MDDSVSKQSEKRYSSANMKKSTTISEKFIKNPGILRTLTNNPVQKRARSYQDINQKTNDYSHVESKVKNYIKNLQEEDKNRSITRTKSMPDSSQLSPFKDTENTEDINLLKEKLAELKIRAAHVEKLNEETTEKIQKNILEKNLIKRTIESVRYQLDDLKERNNRNPIEMIIKVCTPRKNQKEDRTEAIIYPTSTSFLSQSFTLTDNSLLDSIEGHPTLKKNQQKYYRLNEHFDIESEDGGSPDKILLTKPEQSKRKQLKKKLIKVFFGKCVDETCLEENRKSSVDSKRFPTNSVYNSNY